MEVSFNDKERLLLNNTGLTYLQYFFSWNYLLFS